MNSKNDKHMKRVVRAVWTVVLAMACVTALAQNKNEDARMTRDIEVAENILSTLMRQESGRRGFFPMEIKGTYVPGYGVTFRMPMGWMGRFALAGVPEPEIVNVSPGGYSYSYSITTDESSADRKVKRESDALKLKGSAAKSPRAADDSAALKSRERFMEVAKSFLADYGDVIGGLKAEERIIITNRSDNFEPDFDMVWVNGAETRRPTMSVEARRGDIDQLKQGKISRSEFMNRLKVINSEPSEGLDPDLEVLSSLFGRLYREDLSKTYYVQGNVRYERLKDFGAMFYMKVYSSLEMDGERYMMPTVNLRDMSQEERDKKVKELYPKFESELKDNIVEYGRTLRSLKDDEQLVFNVKLTKCEGCGIPGMLELSIKSSALKDYSSGKASKEATLSKISVKKTGTQ